MKRPTVLGVIIPALALGFLAVSESGAFAQDPPRAGGERPTAGGGQAGGGGAGPRTTGGGGGAGPRNEGAAPPPVSSGNSGGGSSWGAGGSARPQGGVATPRQSGSNGGNGEIARRARPRDAGVFRRSPTDDQASGRARPGTGESSAGTGVPWYSRSRGGNPSTGTVAKRGDEPVSRPPGGGGYYPGNPYYPGYGGGYGGGYYNCYYYGYGCYGNPWGYGGFGLGYFFYNPYWWSYGAYGYGGDYGDYGYGGGYGGGYSPQATGGIRLKVKPNTASVYVDGYYAGRVDDFDNMFQKLSIALGVHKLEFSAPGYRPLVIEVNIRDWDTITYEGRLEPIR